MKLHEIGLFAKDPQASQTFYHDTLGLDLHHGEDGLSAIDGGWPGVEIGACSGYPDSVHISYIVDDVDKLAKELRAKGIKFRGPGGHSSWQTCYCTQGSDGLRVLIRSPAAASPDWVQEMVK